MQYITKVSESPISKQPKCASFMHVKKSVSDELILAKLHFFARTSKVFMPYLEKFQTDCPMLPFADQELNKLLKSLLIDIVKPAKLGTYPTVEEMLAIDLEDNDNLIDCKNVGVGVSVKEQLIKLKLTEAKLRQFKNDCVTCIKSIVAKMRERESDP